MKKNQKYIYGTLVAILVVGVAVGYYYYGKNAAKKNQEQAQQGKFDEAPENKDDDSQEEKTDNKTQDVQPVQTKPSTTTTTVPTTLPILGDVSLTVNVVTDNTTAPDSTTTAAAGSIFPTFYMPAGTYTVQKLVSGSWKDIITNQAYAGHGGLAAWFAGPTEDNISYRVVRIENGKVVSISKTYVVNRTDLTTGIHTYN